MIEALAYAGPAHWGHGPWGGGGGPWFLFGPLMWIVVIGAVAFITRRAGLWGPRKGQNRWGSWSGWTGQGGAQDAAPGPQASAQAAEDILAERFARGEIDEAEYQERLTTLRASR